MISIAGKNLSGKASQKSEGEDGACSHSGCGRTEVYKCQYCEEPFCKEHLKAKPSPVIGILHSELSESIKEMIENESAERGGHSCVPYFDVWLSKKGVREEEAPEPSESKEIARPKHMAVKKPGHAKAKAAGKHVLTKQRSFKKYIAVVFLLVAGAAAYYFQNDIVNFVNPSCSDGTPYDTCSQSQPYFCFNGTLVERATMCGCLSGYITTGDICREPYSCIDKTIPGECSPRKPFFCSDGKLVAKASLCGCPEYFTPLWANSSPMWNVSSPTLLSNPKWYTSDLTFFISKDCASIQRGNMIKAISYIVNNTNTSLTFTEVEDGCPEIIVRCLNVTISSPLEQGVAETILTKKNEVYYSVITNAEITVTMGSQGCSPPVTQIHQLLHALGLAHVTDPTSMLYYKFGCLQELKNSTKNDLAQIYPKV